MINILKNDDSLRLLCETLGMHRCNLYHEPRPDEDQPIKDALRLSVRGTFVQYSWNSFAEKAGVFSVKAMTRRRQAA